MFFVLIQIKNYGSHSENVQGHWLYQTLSLYKIITTVWKELLG